MNRSFKMYQHINSGSVKVNCLLVLDGQKLFKGRQLCKSEHLVM